jgi:hypothetical protein
MVEIATTMQQFESVDKEASVFNQIHDAQQILDTMPKRDDFAAQFMRCQGLFEFLWPDTKLRPIEESYRFLARVYASIAPNNSADLLLWQKLGAKTMEIVHAHLTGITIDADKLENVAMDAAVLEALRDGGLFPAPPKLGQPAPTALEVLQRLEERIKARMAGTDGSKIWKSLTERLDRSQTLLPACVIAYGGIGVEGEKFMQEEHIDFPIKYNTKDKLPDLLPFTIHLPLSLEGSKLYISHLKKEIFLEYGSMLVVRGDCKHAGCIYDTPSYRMFSYITTPQYKTDGKKIYLLEPSV